MTLRLIRVLGVLLAGALAVVSAHGSSITVGYVSYDVVGAGLAQFDVFNGTGANGSMLPDTTFPIASTLGLTNLSLTVSYAGGRSVVFGPAYFSLSNDGESLNGTALSTLAGAPVGLNGAVGATLSGMFTGDRVTLTDGNTYPVSRFFSVAISDPGGLMDGDLGVISAATTPEPSAWLLAGTGLVGLVGLRRRRREVVAAVALVGMLGVVKPSAASTVNLSAWTAPNAGASGTTAVNVTGTGFPGGAIAAANVRLTLAATCGGAGTVAAVNSVMGILGTSARVQFVIPGSLGTGTYFVSLSGVSGAGTAFASGNCAQVSVVGGAPVATLSVSAVAFTTLAAGTVSTAQSVLLTNTGSAALNVAGIGLSGTGANLFSQTNNCGTSLGVGGYCTINATFSPKVAGSYTAALTVSDNASPSAQTASLTGTATAAALTIDTTLPADWKISNGTLTLDWNSVNGHIFGIHLVGYPDNLVDLTSSNGGIYMDNSGLGSGTTTATYTNAGSYLDWSITTAANSANAYTYSEHFVITPNDPGVHLYFVANHKTTDIAGSIGQVQWVYRSNLNDFPNTYAVNADLSNPGPVTVPLPPASENFSTDPGRAVSDATVDLHGFTLPAGFTRQFYTKYDYSSYNYLHQAHGTFGSTYGAWAYFPSNESLVGGPTKQNLIYTGNLIILEAYSNHYDNALTLSTPAGTASSRLFGPFYVHFNTIGQAYTATGNAINTPDDMYQDTLQAGASFHAFYDTEQQLLQSGYVPSTGRGSVAVQVNGVTGAPKTAWAVLSDPQKNIQFSSQGYQYWADISATGTAHFTGVVPGTYRLSTYVLGQFGELRQDGIVVNANQNTIVPAVSFVAENFGTPVFTIGVADRSSHEFLHGHDAAGHDDREFWGTWNYWADFQANAGAVIYNATAGPAGAASNNLNLWNYNHWGTFDPGLYGGVYSSADDTTDGYKYAIPTYVAALPGATGINGVATRVPAWQVHFATPANAANYQYAVLSVALACVEGSYVLNLNGTARTWGYRTAIASDCAVRSGLSAYTLWVAFQFPVSALNGANQDNLLTLGVSQIAGTMDDAIRLELTNVSAAPAVTGWNDYEFVGTSSTANNVPANDAVANP